MDMPLSAHRQTRLQETVLEQETEMETGTNVPLGDIETVQQSEQSPGSQNQPFLNVSHQNEMDLWTTMYVCT